MLLVKEIWVKVKVLDIDSRGKIKLSMKAVDAEENA